MYELVYAAEVHKQIEKIDQKNKRSLKRALEKLSVTPDLGKKLVGELKGLWSYRQGNYRIIYQIENRKLFIFVLSIAHRRHVYSHFTRKR